MGVARALKPESAPTPLHTPEVSTGEHKRVLKENRERKKLLKRTMNMSMKLIQDNKTQKLEQTRLMAEKVSLQQELTAEKDKREAGLAAIAKYLSEMDQREYPLETAVHNM